MSAKVLVTFSSGYGATREVAEAIARILAEEKSFLVETRPINECLHISEFGAIVIGTSVRADRPLANTRDFFASHHAELRHKNFALFIVCLTASSEEGREKARKEYLPQILSKYPHLSPVSAEAFGGKIDFAKLNPVMQNIVKFVLRKIGLPDNGSMDTRDWPAVENWAVDLRKKLRDIFKERELSA
jgi:menaquinone-dependent protoporphyrinogen oxidase